jgi:hypothetical protein
VFFFFCLFASNMQDTHDVEITRTMSSVALGLQQLAKQDAQMHALLTAELSTKEQPVATAQQELPDLSNLPPAFKFQVLALLGNECVSFVCDHLSCFVHPGTQVR